MNALRTALLTLCLGATGALAGAPRATTPEARPDPAAREQNREAMERRIRTLRAVGLAEALDLDTAEALRIDAVMKPFDERRRPLQAQVFEAMKTLRHAAGGEAATAGQVDDATVRVLDARAQIAQIDREMFAALAQGRSPQQKAKLALFFAHFQEEARGLHALMRGPGGHPGDERGAP